MAERRMIYVCDSKLHRRWSTQPQEDTRSKVDILDEIMRIVGIAQAKDQYSVMVALAIVDPLFQWLFSSPIICRCVASLPSEKYMALLNGPCASLPASQISLPTIQTRLGQGSHFHDIPHDRKFHMTLHGTGPRRSGDTLAWI